MTEETCCNCRHKESHNDGIEPCNTCSEYYTSNFNKKPELKIIDLSEIKGGSIDMEFDWDTAHLIDKLQTIDYRKDNMFKSIFHGWYRQCRIRQNHWHEWGGESDCPLPIGLVLHLRLRSSEIVGSYLEDYRLGKWKHGEPSSDDIISFKVIEVSMGYCYPVNTKKPAKA